MLLEICFLSNIVTRSYMRLLGYENYVLTDRKPHTYVIIINIHTYVVIIAIGTDYSVISIPATRGVLDLVLQLLLWWDEVY